MGWEKEGKGRLGLGKVGGTGGHVGLSQLDLPFGPAGHGLRQVAQASCPLSWGGEGGICLLIRGHRCLSSCPPGMKFVFACLLGNAEK